MCRIFFEASTAKITVIEVKCVLWPGGQTGGGALEMVQNFNLAEGLKIEFFWHYQVYRESGLVQTFCESCIRPHDLEICDSKLSNLKSVGV